MSDTNRMQACVYIPPKPLDIADLRKQIAFLERQIKEVTNPPDVMSSASKAMVEHMVKEREQMVTELLKQAAGSAVSAALPPINNPMQNIGSMEPQLSKAAEQADERAYSDFLKEVQGEPVPEKGEPIVPNSPDQEADSRSEAEEVRAELRDEEGRQRTGEDQCVPSQPPSAAGQPQAANRNRAKEDVREILRRIFGGDQ